MVLFQNNKLPKLNTFSAIWVYGKLRRSFHPSIRNSRWRPCSLWLDHNTMTCCGKANQSWHLDNSLVCQGLGSHWMRAWFGFWSLQYHGRTRVSIKRDIKCQSLTALDINYTSTQKPGYNVVGENQPNLIKMTCGKCASSSWPVPAERKNVGGNAAIKDPHFSTSTRFFSIFTT